MKRRTAQQGGETASRLAITAMMLFVGTVAHANSLYDEYMQRKQRYEERGAEVRRDFLALPDKKEWRREIVHHAMIAKLDDAGEGYIYLSGKLAEFATKYSLEEMAVGLWDIFDGLGTERRDSLVALVYATQKRNAHALPFPNNDNIIRAKGTLAPRSPHFSGFDRELVALECAKGLSPERINMDARVISTRPESVQRDRLLQTLQMVKEGRTNPDARRQEYIEAITRILADPNIRKENPLETRNLIYILFSVLKAEEAIQTFQDYMFYDLNAGEDYRLQEGDWEIADDLNTLPRHNIFRSRLLYCHSDFRRCLGGRHLIPIALQRFANASAIERKVGTGGGGTPIHATRYLMCLGLSFDEALKYVEDYKQGNPDLTDAQKEALEEIILFIKEKRFCTDALLKSDNPAARTWAPAYGKNGDEGKVE